MIRCRSWLEADDEGHSWQEAGLSDVAWYLMYMECGARVFREWRNEVTHAERRAS